MIRVAASERTVVEPAALVVVRNSIVRDGPGFRPGFDGFEGSGRKLDGSDEEAGEVDEEDDTVVDVVEEVVVVEVLVVDDFAVVGGMSAFNSGSDDVSVLFLPIESTSPLREFKPVAGGTSDALPIGLGAGAGAGTGSGAGAGTGVSGFVAGAAGTAGGGEVSSFDGGDIVAGFDDVGGGGGGGGLVVVFCG